jgi:hypothetical protein
LIFLTIAPRLVEEVAVVMVIMKSAMDYFEIPWETAVADLLSH